MNQEQEIDIRQQAIEWHNLNTRSAHNPYHARNSWIAKIFRHYMSYMHWYKVIDAPRFAKCNIMIARHTGDGLEIYFSKSDKSFFKRILFPEDIAKNITDWVESEIKSVDGHDMHKTVFESAERDPASLGEVSFSALNVASEKYQLDHQIDLEKADNDFYKMLRKRMTGE